MMNLLMILLQKNNYFPFGQLLPNRHASTDSYRYGFNGMEKDDELKGEGNSYDYMNRFYDPRIGRFTSLDKLKSKFTYASPYVYVLNNPIYLIDSDGRDVAGYPVKPLSSFLKVLKKWNIEAQKLQYRRNTIAPDYTNPGMSRQVIEDENTAKLRIFAHDMTANKQIINSVGSYNNNFGKFIDVGLPLDLKHFINYANLAYSLPDDLVKRISIHREYRQSLDPRDSGFSSAFVANDVFSNYLGVYFGGDLKSNDSFDEELGVFLNEVKILFETGTVENGKYITIGRIKELKSLAKTYYGTEELTAFQNGGEFYGTEKIQEANKAAHERINPIYEKELQAEWILSPGPEPGYRKVQDDENKVQEEKQQQNAESRSSNYIICFVKGTKIWSENGLVNIEDIKSGNKVYSYDFEKNESTLNEVIYVKQNLKSKIVDVEFNNDILVSSTDEHPYYTIKYGWREAKDLNIGDIVKTIKGNTVTVTKTKIYEKNQNVYNFQVKGNQNYYVSELGILVHNKSYIYEGFKD